MNNSDGTLTYSFLLPPIAQPIVVAGSELKPSSPLFSLPETIHRSFVSIHGLSEHAGRIVLMVSAGDEVKAGDILAFYPGVLLRTFFAIKAVVNDENSEELLREFLSEKRAAHYRRIRLFVPVVTVPESGIVERVSPQGELVVIRSDGILKDSNAETYGTVVSLTKRRVVISTEGIMVRACFGVGRRCAGVISDIPDSDGIVRYAGILDETAIQALSGTPARAVIASAITVSGAHAARSYVNRFAAITALHIVRDTASSFASDNFPDEGTAVTLFPGSHPIYGNGISGIVVHSGWVEQ